MKRWLVAAAVLWPLMLATATWLRMTVDHRAWADLIYVAASRICHQRPDRSFQTAGVQWPVCARCAGLYAAAPFGALAAWWLRPRAARDRKWWLAIAAAPTAATIVAEWLLGVAVTNSARGVAALSLGAALAYVLVRVAPGRAPAIR